MIHKIRHYSLLSILLSVLLIVPGIIQAQDGHDLSNEEYALVERFVEVSQIPQTYTSSEIGYQEINNNTTTVTVADNNLISRENTELKLDGIILANGEKNYDAQGELMVSVRTKNYQDETSEYFFGADAIMRDQTLYLQSDYLTDEGEWMVIDGEDNIPELLADSDIDNLFDLLNDSESEEAFDLIITDAELLAPYVTSISLTERTLDDESTDEMIRLEITDDQFDKFLVAVYADDPDASFVTELDPAQIDGFFILEFLLNEDGQQIGSHGKILISFTDIDLHALDPDQPEDTWFSMEIESNQTIIYANIDAEVDPIEAPE